MEPQPWAKLNLQCYFKFWPFLGHGQQDQISSPLLTHEYPHEDYHEHHYENPPSFILFLLSHHNQACFKILIFLINPSMLTKLISLKVY